MVLAASCFIVNAGVARVAMDAGVPADRLAGLRSVGTAAALLLIVVALRRVRTLRVSLTEVPWLLLYGVVGVALLQVSYFVAIHRLPVGIALLLEYLAPVLIALWAWLVQRRPFRRISSRASILYGTVTCSAWCSGGSQYQACSGRLSGRGGRSMPRCSAQRRKSLGMW